MQSSPTNQPASAQPAHPNTDGWHFDRHRRSPYWLGIQIVDGTGYPVIAVHDDMGNLVVVG